MRRAGRRIFLAAAVVAAGLLTGALFNAFLYGERTWEGRFTADEELMDFRCCGGPGAWWADGWWVEGPAAEEVVRRYHDLDITPYTPAAVRVKGVISHRKPSGPLGIHKRVLRVEEVLSVRAMQPGERFGWWRKILCAASYLFPF